MRVIPWTISFICLAACVASLLEIHRLKARLGEVSTHHFNDHAAVRQFVIRAALSEADQPIVVVGDSITEMAPLPPEACGHPIVNAGIGGLSIGEYALMAPRLFADHKPFLIVNALGANDIGSKHAGADYSELIHVLGKFSARLTSVSVTSDADTERQISSAAAAAKISYLSPELPPSKMLDGIHYTAKGYRAWIPIVQSAIVKECG